MELEQLIVRIDADTKPLQTALGSVDRQASASIDKVTAWGDKLTNSLTRAAVRGEGLSGVLKGLAKDLAAATLQETVVKPASSLLGALIGSLFGRAGGGSVSPSTPYVVGERGPELFVPSTAGSITRNSEASAAAAPVSVSVSVDARGADPATAARLEQTAQAIQEKTFAAVFAAMERGGRYARISGRRA